MNLEPIDKFVPEFWEGSRNRIVRYWVYLEKGFELINKGRYYILAIGGLYYTLKLTSVWWIVGMFLVGIPIFIIIGRYYLHRVSRIQEWVNATFGSVLGYNQYNLTIRQTELLEEILKELHDLPKGTYSNK